MQGAKDSPTASPVHWQNHDEAALDKETNFSFPPQSSGKESSRQDELDSEKETRVSSDDKEAHLVETSLTGDDKVHGPNVPVGHVQPDEYSNSHSTSTTSAEERIETGSLGGGSGHVIAEDKHHTVNEKEATTEMIEEEEQEKEDESKYPSGVALTLLTLGLCMSTFVVALDNTIIGKLSSMSVGDPHI